jgi:adenylate kinase
MAAKKVVENFLVIVLFGKNGCGKGTQAEILCREKKLRHISSGDEIALFLRKETQNQDEIGYQKIAEEEKNNGRLVPSYIVNYILSSAITNAVSGGFRGVLFDGYPRTKDQALNLMGILSELGLGVNLAIEYDVTDEIALERVEFRRQKAVAANQIPRKEDEPETAKKRLALYNSEIMTAKNVLCGLTKGKEVTISASGTVAEVSLQTSFYIDLLWHQPQNNLRY